MSPAPNRVRLAALGLRVRVLRVARRWSQEQLAAAAGLDRTCVARLELGRHAPTVITVRRIAGALDVPLGELLASTSGSALVLRDRPLRGEAAAGPGSTSAGPEVSIVDGRGSCQRMRRPA